MSLGSNPSKQKNIKSDSTVTQVGGSSGRFIGLKFNKQKKIIPEGSTEISLFNPTILISDTDIFFDFSHIRSNKKETNNLKVLFKSTVKKNETLTITNGEYLNELTGDTTTYDISGTIKFKSFDENNLTVKAEIVSLNNQSDVYKTYDYRYFLKQLTWIPESTITSEEIIELNEIVNMIPSSSLNSFSSTLGEIKENDVIELLIQNKSYTFKILNFYKDQENIEHIEVYEEVPIDIDLFGSNIFVRLKRRETKRKLKRKTITSNTNNKKNTYDRCLQEIKIGKSECLKVCGKLSGKDRKTCKESCNCQWSKLRLKCWEKYHSAGSVPKTICNSLVSFCDFEDWQKSPCNDNRR